MGARATWFVLGAAAASLFWLVVLRLIDQQLFAAFFGMTGH
jgi:arginine exporter protein ArgO